MLLPLGMPAHPSASATLGGGLLAAGRSRRTSEATVRLAGVPGDGADGQQNGWGMSGVAPCLCQNGVSVDVGIGCRVSFFATGNLGAQVDLVTMDRPC